MSLVSMEKMRAVLFSVWVFLVLAVVQSEMQVPGVHNGHVHNVGWSASAARRYRLLEDPQLEKYRPQPVAHVDSSNGYKHAPIANMNSNAHSVDVRPVIDAEKIVRDMDAHNHGIISSHHNALPDHLHVPRGGAEESGPVIPTVNAQSSAQREALQRIAGRTTEAGVTYDIPQKKNTFTATSAQHSTVSVDLPNESDKHSHANHAFLAQSSAAHKAQSHDSDENSADHKHGRGHTHAVDSQFNEHMAEHKKAHSTVQRTKTDAKSEKPAADDKPHFRTWFDIRVANPHFDTAENPPNREPVTDGTESVEVRSAKIIASGMVDFIGNESPQTQNSPEDSGDSIDDSDERAEAFLAALHGGRRRRMAGVKTKTAPPEYTSDPLDDHTIPEYLPDGARLISDEEVDSIEKDAAWRRVSATQKLNTFLSWFKADFSALVVVGLSLACCLWSVGLLLCALLYCRDPPSDDHSADMDESAHVEVVIHSVPEHDVLL
jgi:hypothetical protein